MRAEIQNYFGALSPKVSGPPWTLWLCIHVCQCFFTATEQHTLGLILRQTKQKKDFSRSSVYCRSHREMLIWNCNVCLLIKNFYSKKIIFKLGPLEYYWRKIWLSNNWSYLLKKAWLKYKYNSRFTCSWKSKHTQSLK